MELNYDFYYGTKDFTRYLFIKIPRVLLEAEELRGICFDARMFFSILHDRTYLSARNGWVDDTGRVYIYYTMKAGMWITGFGHSKMVRIFAELEKAGLIEKERQGLGKPMKIYVKNLFKNKNGTPIEYTMAAFPYHEAVLDGQMDFLKDMDAATTEASAHNSTNNAAVADSASEDAANVEKETLCVPMNQSGGENEEADEASVLTASIMKDYYAEIGVSSEEAAEIGRRIASMSSDEIDLYNSRQNVPAARSMDDTWEQAENTAVPDANLNADRAASSAQDEEPVTDSKPLPCGNAEESVEENAVDAPAMSPSALADYYAAMPFSPAEAAESEKHIATMSPEDIALIRSIQTSILSRQSGSSNVRTPAAFESPMAALGYGIEPSIPLFDDGESPDLTCVDVEPPLSASMDEEVTVTAFVAEEPLESPCNEEEPPVEDVENVENLPENVESSPAEPAFSRDDCPQTSENEQSRLPKNGSLDFRKTDSIKNKNKNNNFSTKNQSNPPSPFAGKNYCAGAARWVQERMDEIEKCRAKIFVQIGYEELCEKHPMQVELLNGLVGVIVDVMRSTKKRLTIGCVIRTIEDVRTQFAKLDREHMLYILESMDNSSTVIRNPYAYMLTTLYNAPNTISAYYDAKVRHDMAQPSWYRTTYSRRAS